ncbi:hypothetical protein GRI97_09360 [Altererythrobacter xixiisoli]|uniref:CDP-alcohol phosphatidyltransferase family protein n=1 Tax=Croceibacterium xixiisoli TaxID=1476466 RepID=A0A6I4TT97_9SPHN|nr:CDP-alcohol phosphatidyltransferase family protein [Croceibacterium xixiisoli]MXO99196.1 hypothetical protein [Croceibacterium xixiisoli]
MIREIAIAGGSGDGADKYTIAVPGGWSPSEWSRSELARLAPMLDVDIADLNAISTDSHALFVDGESLIGADDIGEALIRPAVHGRTGMAGGSQKALEAHGIARLKQASRSIVAATGKAGDGIVSRYINRPISQAISLRLLRIPGISPMHATCGTAALGLGMATCLFFGGDAGLIAGAFLFQAASIFDGVDGEIARATFRTSRRGAMLDSLIDAATNLAFIAGLTFNLWHQGFTRAAAFGAIGLVLLATGLLLIGRRARALNDSFTFDAVKHHFRGRQSIIMKWLTWITMRDFFAAAGAVLILIDLAPHALVAFAVVAIGWFFVTIATLFRTRTPKRMHADKSPLVR